MSDPETTAVKLGNIVVARGDDNIVVGGDAVKLQDSAPW
jgi:hypothetical protein